MKELTKEELKEFKRNYLKRSDWLNRLYDSARREMEYRMKTKTVDDEEWTILMAVMVIASKELRCNPDDIVS